MHRTHEPHDLATSRPHRVQHWVALDGGGGGGGTQEQHCRALATGRNKVHPGRVNCTQVV